MISKLHSNDSEQRFQVEDIESEQKLDPIASTWNLCSESLECNFDISYYNSFQYTAVEPILGDWSIQKPWKLFIENVWELAFIEGAKGPGAPFYTVPAGDS